MASKLHLPTLEHVLGLAETAVNKDLPLYQFKGELAKLVADAKAGVETVVHDAEGIVAGAEKGAETLVETVVDRVKKVKSHADAAAVAHELGLDIPADVKAAWNEAKTVAEKVAHLTKVAEAQPPAAAPAAPAE